MKIAIVHDWLIDIGGAESCLKRIYGLFPGDIFTLIYKPETVEKLGFGDAKIRQSFISRLPFAKKRYRNYLGFFPKAIESFDLSEYDVILSSSHAVAKGVITNTNQLHICYCHTPIRYAWDLTHQYLRESGLNKGLLGTIAKGILHKIRIWDYTTANRPDFWIANSQYIAKRIKKVYNRDAAVIYPPVDVDQFPLGAHKDEFFLTASRMVPYKKMDLIVQAFTQMPEKKLRVIGDGPDFKKIQKIALGAKNIELIGYQPRPTLIESMQNAKAFVFAAEEDFGIIPVEAQACGTPVIAYGLGGATETVVDGKTGLFFGEQTPQSLIEAVGRFDKTADRFDPKTVRKNAERFSADVFSTQFKEFVEKRLR